MNITRRLVLAASLALALAFILLPHGEEWTAKKFDPPKPSPAPTIERTKATWKEKKRNERLAREYSKALGYTPKEVKCLITLWTRESRFDHLADNPRSSAYGIAQRLGETSKRPDLQILRGLKYLDHRYRGSACRALSWWYERKWY